MAEFPRFFSCSAVCLFAMTVDFFSWNDFIKANVVVGSIDFWPFSNSFIGRNSIGVGTIMWFWPSIPTGWLGTVILLFPMYPTHTGFEIYFNNLLNLNDRDCEAQQNKILFVGVRRRKSTPHFYSMQNWFELQEYCTNTDHQMWYLDHRTKRPYLY